MGDRHHGAFEIVQEALQPRHGFRIQVVGWFVEQQHVRFFQQQTAQRDAAALTTGEVADFGIPVRQAQRIGGTLQLNVQVMAVVRLDNLFQLALFCGQLVEIRFRLGVQRVDFIQTLQRADHFGHRFLHRFTHGVFRVELRLLRQVADFNAGLRTRFTFDIFIDAGHNAQQGRFTRAV